MDAQQKGSNKPRNKMKWHSSAVLITLIAASVAKNPRGNDSAEVGFDTPPRSFPQSPSYPSPLSCHHCFVILIDWYCLAFRETRQEVNVFRQSPKEGKHDGKEGGECFRCLFLLLRCWPGRAKDSAVYPLSMFLPDATQGPIFLKLGPHTSSSWWCLCQSDGTGRRATQLPRARKRWLPALHEVGGRRQVRRPVRLDHWSKVDLAEQALPWQRGAERLLPRGRRPAGRRSVRGLVLQSRYV